MGMGYLFKQAFLTVLFQQGSADGISFICLGDKLNYSK